MLGELADGAGSVPRPEAPVLVPLFDGCVIALYVTPGAFGSDDCEDDAEAGLAAAVFGSFGSI